MTEKEKMYAGVLYDANYDQEILADRTRAKELCYDYNHLRPGEHDERAAVLKKLLGSVGANCVIEPNFQCDYGYNITVGDNFASNHNLVILDGGKATFGNSVFIGPNCGFYTAGHPLDAERRIRGLEYAYLPYHSGRQRMDRRKCRGHARGFYW
jgi:Acetyltransferase (isoleucine patch superfamily)